MPTVITTPGAATANSYASVVEANAYHTTHLYAAKWTAASDATKETALIMATRLLDNMYEWDQWRTDDVQALEWPRTGIVARNQREFLLNDEIPIELKNATAELARLLIEKNLPATNLASAQGIESFTAGPVSFNFKDDIRIEVIPDSVYYMIPSWWGFPRGSSHTRELVRT